MIQAATWRRWYCHTLVVALVVRLLAAVCVQLLVSQTPGRLCLIAGDAEGYWELGGKVAAIQDYSIYDPPRFVLRMPGFPILLAVPRWLFGNNPFAARILLAFVGACACALAGWLGRELAGDGVGVFASAYTAVSPTLVLFSVLFLSEIAFAAGMVASLIAAAKLVRHESSSSARSIGQATFTGILVGVATYMRPTWILVGPGLGACLLVFGRAPFRRRLIEAVFVCVGLGISLSPWIYRNFHVTGHFVPTTLWEGPSLYDGLNPNFTGDSDMRFFEQDQLLATMSEYEMNQEYRQRAWKFAAEHPGQVISFALLKQARFWNPTPNGEQFQFFGVGIIAWLAFLPLMTFAAIGACYAWRDPWMLILTIAPLAYFAVLHLLFVGSLRYRLPAEFPLAVMAAYGLCRSTGICGVCRDRKTVPELTAS